MKVTILGCGSSGGVPLIGCSCRVCTSDHPENKRSRVSILMEINGKRILIDTSPDLRQQALRHHFSYFDAILYTHAHADHCHGIDEVRSFNFHKDGPIDIYADTETMERLQTSFAYIFKPHMKEQGWYKPLLTPHLIDTVDWKAFHVADEVEIIPFEQRHGESLTLGFRAANFAYSTDVNNLPEESLQTLENLDVWVVDCLGYNPMPTHAHLELALEWIEQLRPKRAILTHMGHTIDYDTLKQQLPPHVEPAYDGLVIEIR